MAKVTVHMYATVREASGTPFCEIEAGDLTELLAHLKKRFGSRMVKVIGKSSAKDESIVVLLNGRNIVRASGRRTRLKDGDEVSIFPPVSGG